MFTEKKPRLRIAVPVALPSLVQTRSMQGSSETDVSEFMVAPKSSPLHSVAMTATPVAKVAMTDRNCLGSMETPRKTVLRLPCPGDEMCVFMSPGFPKTQCQSSHDAAATPSVTFAACDSSARRDR